MNTTYWIAGVIVVLLVILGVWWSMNGNQAAQGTATSTADVQTTQTQSASGSLAALAAKGGSWKCDVTHTSDKDATTGTVYVSDGKVRGDFTSNVAQVGPVESHMISDGEYVYVWSSMMPSGLKMKATASSEGGTQTSGGQQDFYNQNYDYNCQPWSSDSTQFTLPTNITFNDMSAMIPGASGSAGAKANGSATMPAGANCSMCDQAPSAEAKAACKAALHC